MCLKLNSVVVLIVNIKNQISTFCSRRVTDDGWEQQIYDEREQEQEEVRSSHQDQAEPSTAQVPWGFGHSEKELSDFVKDAIRPEFPPHDTPNTGLDQQIRGDPTNESEMSYYNSFIPEDGSSSSPPSPSQYSADMTHQTAHPGPGPAEDSNLMDDWSELATPTPAAGHFKAEEDEQLKPDANSNCQHTTTSRQEEQVFPRCDANTKSDESQVPSNPSCCSAELGEQERQEDVSEEDAVVVWTRGRSTNICSLLVTLHLLPWPGLHWQPLTMQVRASNQGSRRFYNHREGP